MLFEDYRLSDKIGKAGQTRFGGLNHTKGAADNELWDMRNLCSDNYPVLSTRPRRRFLKQLKHRPNGMYSWDGLIVVDGTEVSFDGEVIGTVTDSRKTFAGIGAYVVILPDKVYIDTNTRTMKSIESSTTVSGATFGNGTLYEESATANMIQVSGTDWKELFSVGDAVEITGCVTHPENNKTPIIREIDGDKLLFYENVFKLDGDASDIPYTEPGAITIKRSMPDMDYIVEHENRLWGCKGNHIYASKLGNIFNWNVFDGLSTDSYAVDVGSSGTFTGMSLCRGYLVFFKENHIYKMYGSEPKNFQLVGSATLGLTKTNARSCAVANETLIFLSRAGFTAYTGGVPNPIHAVFGGEHFKNAVAGSDGVKYYVSAQKEDGSHRLFVYDSQRGMWHIEDESEVISFAWHDGNLYMLLASGGIWLIGNIIDPPESNEEAKVCWMAETADYYGRANSTLGGYEPNAKSLTKLQLRIEMERGAETSIMISHDGRAWEHVESLRAEKKRSYYIAVKPNRCDYFRLRFEGKGHADIYALSREYSTGSEHR